MKRSSSLTLIAVLLAIACPAVSQELSEPFTETLDVRVINIEVIATDKNDRTVVDLQADDFEILVDGEPVELSNFYFMDRARRPDAPRETSYIDPIGAPTDATRSLQLVVLIDNRHLSPFTRTAVMRRLHTALLNGLRPGDKVMLTVLSDQLEVVQDFTDDGPELAAAFDRMKDGPKAFARLEAERAIFLRRIQTVLLVDRPIDSSPRAGFASLDFDIAVSEATSLAIDLRMLATRRSQLARTTLATIGDLASSLAGIPGRKAIFYVSDGLPSRPADGLLESYRTVFETWALLNGVEEVLREITDLESLRLDSEVALDHMIEAANSSGVSFYPISDIKGGSARGVSTEFRSSGSRLGEALEDFSAEATLLQMADATGGIPFTRSVAVDDFLARVRSDFESFYSLGFKATPEWQGSFHSLKVRVQRDGVKVRHPKGFADKDPVQKLEDLTLAAIVHKIESNPLGVTIVEREQKKLGRNRYQVSFLITVPFNKLLLLPEAEAHVGSLDLVLLARDEKGRRSPMRQIFLPIRIPNDQIAAALTGSVGYPLELEMRKGTQTVTIGIHDRVSQIDSNASLSLAVGLD